MLLSIKLAFPRALTPCFPYQTVIGVKYSGEILSTSQTPADFYQNYLQLKCLTNDSSLMTSKVCFVKSIYACMPLFNFSIKLSQCPQVHTWTPYIWETQNIFLKLILLTRSPYHNTTMTHLWFEVWVVVQNSPLICCYTLTRSISMKPVPNPRNILEFSLCVKQLLFTFVVFLAVIAFPKYSICS